jgi:uncharacterized membrane protein YhaH (DUF805 family)
MRGFFRWWSLEGRGSRREFAWVFFPALVALIVLLWIVVTYAPDGISSATNASLAVALMIALMAVGAAAMVRRLHDLGQSASWLHLLALLGVCGVSVYKWLPGDWQKGALTVLSIGAASVLVGALTCRRGMEGDNQFGPDPLGRGGLSRDSGLQD